MLKIYDRQQKVVVEVAEYQANLLQQLYGTKWGKYLQPLVTSQWFSKLLSWQDYTPLSEQKIASFVNHYEIELEDYTQQQFKNFAEFFTRRLKVGQRPLSPPGTVLAVADAKLSVFPITESASFNIKGQMYQLSELLVESRFSKLFMGGTLCVYRLGVEDYHRYVASETGRICHRASINGKLHTVRDIALKRVPVFKENHREYCILEHKALGSVMQMEVGALTVGKIHNYSGRFLYRGIEKGYFSLGGSTILVAYQSGRIVIDEDIVEMSQAGIECQVSLGERVGSYNVK
ncbi:phosphatidylserine decarboxylase [Aerococcaceae bacterium DSM 109653]|uniref:Phosphatidylserine decarboxylase n=1 Tax=Fundicoccus ignavus TaxID=2664442 RepID=A0A6I2GGX0_9LACT|nr:phosphatidylserine decarboxylase [Fundicoccus ignavus]MRI82364.1 phosphatidylserine decarboxylase [Fundicoccus ignavus]MRI85082.1 phosphatidylserine decarboxylase [Fundicoccus ignavus]